MKRKKKKYRKGKKDLNQVKFWLLIYINLILICVCLDIAGTVRLQQGIDEQNQCIEDYGTLLCADDDYFLEGRDHEEEGRVVLEFSKYLFKFIEVGGILLIVFTLIKVSEYIKEEKPITHKKLEREESKIEREKY